MKALWQYLKPFKKQLVIGPFFKLAEAVLELFIPMLMAFVIDRGVRENDLGYVFKMGLVMLATVVLGLIFAYICQYSASIASQGFGTNVRNALFTHVGKLSYSQIEEYGPAALVNRITNDVNVAQTSVAMIIRLLIRAPFISIGSVIMAMFIDFKLALLFLISLPVFVLAIYLVMRKTIPMYKRVQGKTDAVAGVLRENLLGVRVIRAFDRQQDEQVRFEERNRDFEKLVVRVGKISAVMNPVTMLLMNFVVVGILYFGANRVYTGGMTQGEITAFISYASYMMTALVVLASLIVLLTRGIASAQRISALLSIEPGFEQQEHLSGESDCKVRFDNVSFSYNSESEYAVENISFSVSKGESIGIIGGTGAGKSTVVNLISRIYTATKGTVLFNGVDIKKYDAALLHQKIGVASQKAVLLSGTVAGNVRQGDPAASDEAVIRALKCAHAYEFVTAKEDGINSAVTRGGTNFSGGQKQRLSIARAVVKNPEILILDDSLSALDYATESKVREAIRGLSKEMSLVVVSQRVSSVMNCDKILLLDQGVQVGFAPHEMLLESSGLYREICTSQLGEEGAVQK